MSGCSFRSELSSTKAAHLLLPSATIGQSISPGLQSYNFSLKFYDNVLPGAVMSSGVIVCVVVVRRVVVVYKKDSLKKKDLF